MKLRRRLGIRYAAISVVCMLLLLGLVYHEFVIEPWMNAYDESPRQARFTWGETLFHLAVPTVLVLGWLIMGRTLTEIERFTKRVEQVHSDNLQEPLPRSGLGDEIDRLSEVFNDMIGRLDASIKNIREFTLHASHELKTPLTVMRAQLETFQRDELTTASQRDWAAGQLDEIQRLASIVDSLTLLTKADAGLIAVEHQPVALDDLVREAYEDAQVLAEPRSISVLLAACHPLQVTGDRHRLRQLLLNLVDNAVKYNEPGGLVRLSLSRVNSHADIVVSNTGAGIPEKIRGHEFERFVRGQDARTIYTEGCGLGLAICAWIVQAHGGTIQITTDADGLTTAHVALPLRS